MNPSRTNQRFLATFVVAAALLLGSANLAQAQYYPRHYHSYYQHPVPVFQGPTITQYSPSTSSFYTVPLARPTLPIAPVYTQNYSFYTYPNLNYYPPSFYNNYSPSFPTTNVIYPVDPLSPYVSSYTQSGMLSPYVYYYDPFQTTAPYKTSTFFRY